MKILIADTYYPAFLKSCYEESPNLISNNYKSQLSYIISKCFGTSDFYSRNLKKMGWDAEDIIPNCMPLQNRWAVENGLANREKIRIFLTKLGINSKINIANEWLADQGEIVLAQVKKAKPNIFYCQDISYFKKELLNEIKKNTDLLVGQIACPLPSDDFIYPYDLILTSFPHYVSRIREKGVASEYFKIGFDESVLHKIGSLQKDINVSFVGGISPEHKGALDLLEYLALHTPIKFFGYGRETLDSKSPILPLHGGEVWGLDMYRTLAKSFITVNRHIDVAENFANNMRLYEATGVGTMLLTNNAQNLDDLFEVGEEVIAYSSKEEAAEMINFYLKNQEKIKELAKKGQEKTLANHTYFNRMEELKAIINSYL